MKKEKIGEKEFEKCMICGNIIKLKEDDYVEVIDYHRGEFYKNGFYHNKCFLDKIRGSQEMKEKSLRLLEQISKLLPT